MNHAFLTTVTTDPQHVVALWADSETVKNGRSRRRRCAKDTTPSNPSEISIYLDWLP